MQDSIPPLPKEDDIVTVAQFNQITEFGYKRIRMLLLAGHLQRVGTRWHRHFSKQPFYYPSEAALRWIRAGFAPLKLRPIVKMNELARMLKVTKENARRLCISHNVPITMDLAFGELITLDSFSRLMDGLWGEREPGRFDRGALLTFLRGAIKNGRLQVKPLSYSEKVEREVKRIAALPEPERTVRAAEFISAWRDAKTVADCLGAYEGKRKRRVESVTSDMEELTRVIMQQ